MKNKPNNAMERSRLLVTDHASACSAQSNRLAHLERSAEEKEKDRERFIRTVSLEKEEPTA